MQIRLEREAHSLKGTLSQTILPSSSELRFVVRQSFNARMSNPLIITVGARGTSVPGDRSLVRAPIVLGTNSARWANPGKVPEADAVHGFVSENGQQFTVLILKDAIRMGIVKPVGPVHWTAPDGTHHSGTAYFKAEWAPKHGQPQYVGVVSKTWKHGRVETKPVNNGRNRHLLAKLDLSDARTRRMESSPAEASAVGGEFYEGKKRQLTGSSRERKPGARRKCIELHGVTCIVCDFNFGDEYGPIGMGFIHVHHEIPIAAGERNTDPAKDLRPVCPNCHAMLHLRSTPMRAEELRKLLQKRRETRRLKCDKS